MRAPCLIAALVLGLTSGCSELLGIEDPVTGDAAAPPDADLDADPDQIASIEATWTIADGYTADADNAGQCPPGAVHATLHADGPTVAVVPFDCAAGTGTAANLALGTYDVWIELTSATGDVVNARSPHATVGLDVVDAVEQAAFTVDGYNGFLRVSWQVVASTCGATEVVSALSTVSATGAALEDIRLCTDGASPTTTVSSALPLGDIITVASLLDAGGATIGSAPPATSTITYGNELVDLGPLQITRD